MVEHVIGNDGVVSPILISGTNKTKDRFYTGLFVLNAYRWQKRIYDDCVSNPKVRSRHRRAQLSEAAETVVSRQARDNLFSDTIF